MNKKIPAPLCPSTTLCIGVLTLLLGYSCRCNNQSEETTHPQRANNTAPTAKLEQTNKQKVGSPEEQQNTSEQANVATPLPKQSQEQTGNKPPKKAKKSKTNKNKIEQTTDKPQKDRLATDNEKEAVTETQEDRAQERTNQPQEPPSIAIINDLDKNQQDQKETNGSEAIKAGQHIAHQEFPTPATKEIPDNVTPLLSAIQVSIERSIPVPKEEKPKKQKKEENYKKMIVTITNNGGSYLSKYALSHVNLQYTIEGQNAEKAQLKRGSNEYKNNTSLGMLGPIDSGKEKRFALTLVPGDATQLTITFKFEGLDHVAPIVVRWCKS